MFLELTFFHPQNVWKLSLNHFAKHVKFELLTNVSYSLLLSRWLIPNANFSIFPSKFFGICQYTLYLSENIIFKKREENLSYILKQAYYSEQIRQTTQENQSAEQNDENI